MSVSKLDAAIVRNELGDALDRVVDGKERVIVHCQGKPVAALIPIEDYELLEEMEDEIDVAEATRILADPNETPEPWESSTVSSMTQQR